MTGGNRWKAGDIHCVWHHITFFQSIGHELFPKRMFFLTNMFLKMINMEVRRIMNYISFTHSVHLHQSDVLPFSYIAGVVVEQPLSPSPPSTIYPPVVQSATVERPTPHMSSEWIRGGGGVCYLGMPWTSVRCLRAGERWR